MIDSVITSLTSHFENGTLTRRMLDVINSEIVRQTHDGCVTATGFNEWRLFYDSKKDII